MTQGLSESEGHSLVLLPLALLDIFHCGPHSWMSLKKDYLLLLVLLMMLVLLLVVS